MKEIRIEHKCQSCKGTGLYRGMGEGDGFAVVCHSCRGTGKAVHAFAYEEFIVRGERKDVRHVLEVNPGIGLGGNLDFGGMVYQEWADGKPFPPGSEMRNFTCPAWWCQSARGKEKPEWKECGFGMFSRCKHFGDKQSCWERWDQESNK